MDTRGDRGARQVGTSWAIEQFGREQLADLVVVNSEFYPKYSACFARPDPKTTIPSIELLTGKKVSSGTLLFLDQIQECPDAIGSSSSCARRERARAAGSGLCIGSSKRSTRRWAFARPEKGSINREKHGLTFKQAQQAFFDPHRARRRG